jgi:hypothetical protein
MSIFRVVLSYESPNASEILNVFHFQPLGDDPSSTAILDDFEAWATTNWGLDFIDFASQEVTLTGLEISRMNIDGTVAEDIGSRVLDVQGGVGADTAPQAAAGYIMANTEFPKQRGSKYIPGVSEGSFAAGVLDAESVGDLILLLLDLYAHFSGAESSVEWEGGILSTTLAAFVPFSGGGQVTDVPAYQRRRKPNVGS